MRLSVQRPRGLALPTQILVGMSLAILLVGFLVGEAVRRIETSRAHEVFANQTELVLSLIGKMMIEAVIVEDGPVIETALEAAAGKLPSMVYIAVTSTDGRPIADAGVARAKISGVVPAAATRNTDVTGKRFVVLVQPLGDNRA